MNPLADIDLSAPLFLLACGAVLVLFLTVAGGAKRPAPEAHTHLTMVALAVLATATYMLAGNQTVTPLFSGALVVDGLGVVFGTTALVGAFLGVLLATPYLARQQTSGGEFLALVLLSAVGMLMVTLAGDLMTLFIGIETMSLAVYVLAGYRRASRHSQEAALKYFVYGAFASGFILFGTALLFGEVGRVLGKPSLSFIDLSHAFARGSSSPLAIIGMALVLSGFAFKVAAVPFHMWAPDVYDGAPTPATAFMVAAVKATAFAGLCRFLASTMLAGRSATESELQIFEGLAVITMLFGNLVAIRQQQIKRMLAYSSVAHTGYLLVGVAAFLANPSGNALSALGYYLLVYTGMTVGAFAVVLAFERRDERGSDFPIERLNGAAHRHPALGLAMALFMLSLAGIPPTAGFFGKLTLFAAAIEAGRVSVVVIAVIASLIGAYYYLRVLVVMHMRSTSSDEPRFSSPYLSAALWACSALVVVAGLWPEPYIAFARRLLAGWTG